MKYPFILKFTERGLPITLRDCFLITTNIKMTQLSSDQIKIPDDIYFVLSKLSRMENANKSCHSQKPK